MCNISESPQRVLRNVFLGVVAPLIVTVASMFFLFVLATGVNASTSETLRAVGDHHTCSLPLRAGGNSPSRPKLGMQLPFPFAHESSYFLIRATDSLTVYLPIVFRTETSPCDPIPGESYAVISVNPPSTDRPAEVHADLNLALRSYEQTTADLGLVDLPGETDFNAPQLPGLFGDNRTPILATVHQVYDWNWPSNSRGDLLTDPEVTLAGFATTPEEIIHVPSSGYNIGSKLNVPQRGVTIGADGYEVLVLYASTERITLKYTREDNVIAGYTIHIEGICVEPNLLDLYQSRNDKGRDHLPALMAGQGVGRADGSEIQVAIRDTGSFMDTRSRKDWWRGR
jgi:hypothetical protein